MFKLPTTHPGINILSCLIFAGFFAIGIAIAFGVLKDGALMTHIVDAVYSLCLMVGNFWFGSSLGSVQKSQHIADLLSMQVAQPQTPPTVSPTTSPTS